MSIANDMFGLGMKKKAPVAEPAKTEVEKPEVANSEAAEPEPPKEPEKEPKDA